MPLTYPIAENAREALASVGDDGAPAARTVGEAREKAGASVALVSEWLRPTPEERDGIAGAADIGVGQGFVQVYEDEAGRPVIAVTFWKREARKAERAPVAVPPEDSVDDLYFSPKAATRKSRKGVARTPDPRQLDLFGGRRAGTPDDDPDANQG